MIHLDRLSALISRFSLSVTPTHPAQANLVVLQNAASGDLTRAIFAAGSAVDLTNSSNEKAAFCGLAVWGGNSNPLLQTMSAQIELDIEANSNLSGLMQLLIAESNIPRCGSAAVVNRLGEILLVRLLREQLNLGATSPGLIGGLADKRLSKAIVAMHENPGKNWSNEKLADIAGLSISRFYQLFRQMVGMTPIAYLRNWRMMLAKQDVERGDRVQQIARRYGYRSTEALTRSFARAFGSSPIEFRKFARRQ